MRAKSARDIHHITCHNCREQGRFKGDCGALRSKQQMKKDFSHCRERNDNVKQVGALDRSGAPSTTKNPQRS